MKKYKVVTNSRGFLNVLYNSINKEFSDGSGGKFKL